MSGILYEANVAAAVEGSGLELPSVMVVDSLEQAEMLGVMVSEQMATGTFHIVDLRR